MPAENENCRGEFCAQHPLNLKRLDDLERKYGFNCDRLGRVENSVHGIDMLKQDQQYLKESILDIKQMHREALSGFKEDFQALQKSISQRLLVTEWLTRAMFLLLIGIAIKSFFFGGGS